MGTAVEIRGCRTLVKIAAPSPARPTQARRRRPPQLLLPDSEVGLSSESGMLEHTHRRSNSPSTERTNTARVLGGTRLKTNQGTNLEDLS